MKTQKMMMTKKILISLISLSFIFLQGFKSIPESQVIVQKDNRIIIDTDAELMDISREEAIELMGIATNEAGNQGIVGMALVMRVVLNRLEHGEYGDSIHEVIFADGQFATAGMPRSGFSLECETALMCVLWGWDESQGALYFCAEGYNGPIPLFRYRGHWFSKK